MQRFGHSIFLFLVLFISAGVGGCDEKTYDEKDMSRLATFTRVVMDIVHSAYIDTPPPIEMKEEDIRRIVVEKNTDFEELKLLDTYDMKIVSHDKQLGAVLWDPENGRKLLEDLRCTSKLDLPAWSSVSYGNDFTLNWSSCQ